MNDNEQARHGQEAQDRMVPSGAPEGGARYGAETSEVSELARHGDPSHAAKNTKMPAAHSASSDGRPRGVVWVRPSELMGQVTSKVAGRGIDFHAELARRARRLPVQTVAIVRRAISERARRLPPLAAFGRGQTHVGATRSGIGLR